MVLTTAIVALSAPIGIDVPFDEATADSVSYSESDADPPICTIIKLEPVRESTVSEELAVIIYDNMIPQGSNPHITEEQAQAAANEILYCIDIYGMNLEEDLPYILSLFYLESRFDPLAENPHSSASGMGQILGMHAWKFPGCEDCRSWRCCDGWMDVEQNIYVAFGIMAYDEYAHCSPDSRWRNIYRYNYNTGPGTGWMVTQHHSLFNTQVQEMLNEQQEDW
jgi:hypothetical protein